MTIASYCQVQKWILFEISFERTDVMCNHKSNKKNAHMIHTLDYFRTILHIWYLVIVSKFDPPNSVMQIDIAYVRAIYGSKYAIVLIYLFGNNQ